MVDAGQWLVLPYQHVRDLPKLRLAPMGVIPQRDRRGRPIVDYTFNGVNQATVPLAPDLMQFGNALERFLQRLHRADTRKGPIFLAKSDIADAFMRVWVQTCTVPTLGALIPSLPGEEPLVAFPLVLPMGWTESPAYFCAVSETITDLTNARIQAGEVARVPHRCDGLADTRGPSVPPLPVKTIDQAPPAPYQSRVQSRLIGAELVDEKPPQVRSQGPLQDPLAYVDSFVDDHIMAVQGDRAYRNQVRSTLFECVDAVLRPLEIDDNPN
jgi:hypothetical protein